MSKDLRSFQLRDLRWLEQITRSLIMINNNISDTYRLTEALKENSFEFSETLQPVLDFIMESRDFSSCALEELTKLRVMKIEQITRSDTVEN